MYTAASIIYVSKCFLKETCTKVQESFREIKAILCQRNTAGSTCCFLSQEREERNSWPGFHFQHCRFGRLTVFLWRFSSELRWQRRDNKLKLHNLEKAQRRRRRNGRRENVKINKAAAARSDGRGNRQASVCRAERSFSSSLRAYGQTPELLLCQHSSLF